jgi:DNA (cytosine-5)-methyltransferase 1
VCDPNRTGSSRANKGTHMTRAVPFAEFFAGIGLVRMALERQGFRAVFANDIDPVKFALYSANFDARDFALCDIRALRGRDIPQVDLAVASFPCTDLSLAGWRRGLAGEESGLLWEFLRVIAEMGSAKPYALLLENVPSFATSNDSRDLHSAISKLNALGYWCDLLMLDARWFVPQSRQRLFLVASQDRVQDIGDLRPSPIRPRWIQRFVHQNRDLRINLLPLSPPPVKGGSLAEVVEPVHEEDARWWNPGRLRAFEHSLRPLHKHRFEQLRNGSRLNWATAYRRTRAGRATWEIRADSVSGCLRTSRGGSSKQALVEGGQGKVRVRWMTHREYARLQGAPDFIVPPRISEVQALFGFGDAVCVPVVEWLAKHYLRPLLDGQLHSDMRRATPRPLALPLAFNAI